MITQFTDVIIDFIRTRNSDNGNPRYHVIFEKAVSRTTKIDAQVAFAVPSFWEQRVLVTLDEAGYIIGLEPAT